MLETEPDTNNTPSNNPESPTPPRRRRAASRPAGPPSQAADAPTIEVTAPVIPEAAAPADEPGEAVAKKTAAKKTAKTPAKKAAAKKAPAKKAAAKKASAKKSPEAQPTLDTEAPTEADEPARIEAAVVEAAAPAMGEAPAKRPARKRATRKTAPADPAPEAIAAADVEPTETTPPPVATPEAPAEQAKRPARKRSRKVVADPFSVQVDLPAEGPAAAESAVDETPGEAEETDADLVEAAADVDAVDPLDTDPTSEESAADDQAEADGDQADEDEDDGDESGQGDRSADDSPRRRRRRRGGRRRRRGGSDDDSDDDSIDSVDTGRDRTARSSNEAESADAEAADAVGKPSAEGSDESTASSDDGEAGESDESGDGQRRRRRRRRRRGEDAGSSADDPAEVVVRVREPRNKRKPNQEVTGIDGSTRMEAKRQRRKEGREAGRRRPPILSEAEFLARRESVTRKMIIRQREDLSQIAVLEDDILVEHYVDRDSATSLIGNVYLGRVQNVLPSMEAAFIDIGRGRNAVLYAGEVDWDSFGANGENRKVEKVLKSGQTILVQVSKDPVGAKGARLTNHVSIPGRYVVYAPGGHLSGISRKLPDTERKRLKEILSDLVGETASVIVRTAAEGASEEELVRDVNRLKAQWEDIEKKVKAGNGPQLLYGEPDLTVRIVRDLFTEDFSELIIQGNQGPTDSFDAVEGYVSHVAPHLAERIKRWEPEGDQDLFTVYRLDEQIAKALERKVFLPSGGSLVIDRTEAMTVIDVNTGKFTGSGGNLEATVTSNNLEAAEEVVRQLRLRDIGGIIVIDFIDMVLASNRELLLRRLVECLGRDRTRHQVAEVTSLGLVQMTRKKIGTGLLEAFTVECPHCEGRGVELHDVPVESQKQADGGARDQRSRRNGPPKPGPIPGRPAAASQPEPQAQNGVGPGESAAEIADDAGQPTDSATEDPAADESNTGESSPAESSRAERGSRGRRGRRGRGSSSSRTSEPANASS